MTVQTLFYQHNPVSFKLFPNWKQGSIRVLPYLSQDSLNILQKEDFYATWLGHSQTPI